MKKIYNNIISILSIMLGAFCSLVMGASAVENLVLDICFMNVLRLVLSFLLIPMVFDLCIWLGNRFKIEEIE